jgi:hypothetical protein
MTCHCVSFRRRAAILPSPAGLGEAASCVLFAAVDPGRVRHAGVKPGRIIVAGNHGYDLAVPCLRLRGDALHPEHEGG